MPDRGPTGPRLGEARDLRTSFTIDEHGTIIDCDDSCAEALGWHRGELVGSPITRIIPERFHEAHRAGFGRFVDTGHMPLEGQRPRLSARHATRGEIDVALHLRRTRLDEAGVAVGVLEPLHRDRSAPAEALLAEALQRAIADQVPLEDLLRRCIGLAARQHRWLVASAWWTDPWLDRLRVTGIWEDTPGAMPSLVAHLEQSVVAHGQGVIGQVWSTGVPRFLHADEPEFSTLVGADTSEAHAALIVPLHDGDSVIGVVEMFDDRPRAFSVDDHHAVWAMADLLGSLLADRLRRETEAVRRERIDIALNAGRMGVWSYHVATRIITWDTRLETMLGFEPGGFPGTLDAFARMVHPDDADTVRGLFFSAINGNARFDSEFRAVTVQGATIWVQTAAAPMVDADGVLRALSGVAIEVTNRVETARQIETRTREAALAADVGRALVSRESIETRLHTTAEAVVRQIDAAFARIWILPPGSETLELQASAGLYTNLDGSHARIGIGQYKIGRIASDRQPHLTNDVQNDPLVSDPEWARREGMVSFAGYPLVVGDVLVGVLGLFARHPLPPGTLAALASIADTIAIAVLQHWSLREMEALIEQTRLHAVEMERAMQDRARVAEVLQSSLLPPSLPVHHDLLLGAAYRAGVEEVGGDFYDVLPARGGWGFMIGDVCGRGPEAARLTALARHTLRTTLLLEHGPAASLGALNEGLLAADTDRRFCTVVCGLVRRAPSADDESGVGLMIDFAIGGHPLPLVLRTDGSVQPVGSPGSLLGILPEPVHDDHSVTLAPGERLVLFTDGVTEAWRAGEMFGVPRLRATIAAQHGQHPQQVADAIVATVSEYSTEASDDLAVLVIGAPAD